MSPVLTTLISTARANNTDDYDDDNDDDDGDGDGDGDDIDDIEDIEDDFDVNVVSVDEPVEPTANETETEEIEQHMRDMDQVVENFKSRVRENWDDPNVRRAFKSFKNNFKKTIEIDNTLVRVMFNFSKEATQNVSVGSCR